MKRGEYLAVKRAEKGLTVPDLALQLGVSADEVERWESGEELPDSEYLLRLSSVLDIPVEDILREDGAERTGEAQATPLSGEESADSRALSADGIAAREKRSGPLYPSARETAPFSSAAGAADGKRRNGFSDGERKFGYVVCALFVLIVAITFAVRFAEWMQRPREVTMGNYREYIKIDVSSTENFDPQDYVVKITAKENISNLRISVRVDFGGYIGTEDFFETVLLEQSYIAKGDTAEREFHLSAVAFERGFEVLSVGGELE